MAPPRLALLPASMRMADARDRRIWHALMEECGCSHMIVGRDHCGPGADASGKAFYEPVRGPGIV